MRGQILLGISFLYHLNQWELPPLEIKKNYPSGVGSVNWSWFDEKGVMHTFHLKNLLFFPDCLVNVLSVTALANQLDAFDGT